MTTKQKKYSEGLEAKGLMKFIAIIPKKWEAHFRKESAKLRTEHLEEAKGKDNV